MKKPAQMKARKRKATAKGKPDATKRPAKGAQLMPRVDGRPANRAAKEIEWFFPRNDFGQDDGLHDPGVETFKGNIYYYIAREIIQNSIDARNPKSSKPVAVEFQSINLGRDKIPDMDSLQEAFRRCAAFWEADPKAKAFFDKAAQMAGAPQIDVLKVSDSNTTGVVGADFERGKDWYNLIRCRGASSKGTDAGGAFGIGKDAPFAASYLRTVLYSTNTDGGQCAFQGVARLATHAPAEGGKADSVGFLGGESGASIREVEEIPPALRRPNRGTDLYILGFIAKKGWEKALRLAVLEYFWPAIHFGDLEVRINSEEISQENLDELMRESAGEEDFNGHKYYDSYISATHEFEDTLPHLREVSLHLRAEQIQLPKRIALVRKSGMVIEHKLFHSALPFCGVFLCRNDVGNAKLREMEPPRHDKLDPDLPEKGANKVIDTEYRTFIRQCIAALTTKDDVKVFDMPEFSRFLPDDDESEEEEQIGEPEQPEDDDPPEGFPRKPPKPEPRKPVPTTKAKKRKSSPPEAEGERVSGADGGEGEGEGDGYDGSGDQNRGGNVNGGSGGGGGGNVNEGRGTGGGSGSYLWKQPIAIRFRGYPTDNAARNYVVTVRPERAKDQEAVLTLQAVGDDTKAPIQIAGARLAGGDVIPFDPAGKVGPVSLSPKAPLRLEIILEEPRKLSIEVIAHEA